MSDLNSIFCPNCHQKTSISTRASCSVPKIGMRYDIAEGDNYDYFILIESLCEILCIAPAKAANREKIRQEQKNGA